MPAKKKSAPPSKSTPAPEPASAGDPWVGKKDELLLVGAAVDRELDDATSRDGSMRGRATILIGAASVVGAIQLGDDFNLFLVVSLILSLAAALCGVVVVFPRSSAAFNPSRMRDAVYEGTSVDEALHHMVRIKLKSLKREDDSIGFRSGFARIGFILLVVSIVFAAVSAVVPTGQGSGGDMPTPPSTNTPTPTSTP